MRLVIASLIISFTQPAIAETVYLSCRGTSEKETGTWELTIKPGSDTGLVSEITKKGAVYSSRKLPLFISDSTYTLQGTEVKSLATLNTTFKVNRVDGNYVHKFWMTNTGLSPRPPIVYRGKCIKKQPVKTLF